MGHRKAKQRPVHTRLNPNLAGKEKDFVRRAMKWGIRNKKQLKNFTNLSPEKIIQIEDEMKFRHRAQGLFPPKNAVERLCINGELSSREISKLSGRSPKSVAMTRHGLAEKGINTRVYPGFRTPPFKVARSIIAYRVYRELGGLSVNKSSIRASSIENISTNGIERWIHKHPGIAKRIEKLSGGIYWKKALKQMEPWIRQKEKEFGKKFKP